MMNGEGTITRLASQMQSAGDHLHADKLRQLQNKLDSGQFYIAFCGHFSAGKSSLINKLCGKPLLPSSPIPTSANIVSLSSGEPEAAIYFNGRETPVPVPPEELAEYCKDGDSIRTIDIRYPIPLLSERTVLLDTPGIDSTDDAHRLATESALHLADVVFYVMDYNHVQSEMNFAFTKHLQEWGKPLYLIVNQIDKHREEELSLEQYRDSVKKSFANWNIHPDGIYYLSLKQPGHPGQQWEPLVWTLRRLMQQAETLRLRSAEGSAEQLIRDYIRGKADALEDVKAGLRDELSAMDNPEEAWRGYESKLKERKQLDEQPDNLYAEWKKETASIIENANLTPALTRDLAEHYLQSRKPGFKVGFFNRAAQTSKEISSRLQNFTDDLGEKVKAGLSWHLKTYVKTLIQSHNASEAFPAEKLNELDKLPSSEWVSSQVHSGAEFSNEYTLTFSRHLSAEIKSGYRRTVQELLDDLRQVVIAQSGRQSEALSREIAEQERQLAAYRKLKEMELQEEEELQLMLAEVKNGLAAPREQLPGPSDFRPDDLQPGGTGGDSALMPTLEATESSASAASGLQEKAVALLTAEKEAGEGEAAAETAALQQVRMQRSRLQTMAGDLREAAALTAEVASLQSASRSMLEKAERLENNRFTVALFGAFSAGKSSFANALLGERILPVSPNPTTAAINTILPPTGSHPHGTVLVKMKPEKKVEEEIRYSLDVLGEPWTDLTGALAAIKGLVPESVAEGAKPHYTFLKAVEKGWTLSSEHFGQELSVTLAHFDEYVANEERSCFVESVHLYHSNPLTDQGMVFVDTPGADSINARHTGVAFNYIKNADAILFVTYYNHAFSQADREFLLQLGRVKDAFELDKMFFIVNASDLASDEEELAAVVSHVEANLLSQGVRNARIYPLSSQQAVEAKEKGNTALLNHSSIVSFEREFIRFTLEELTDIAVRSGRAEFSRAASIVQDWTATAAKGKAEREHEIASLQQSYSQAETLLRSGISGSWNEDLEKETDELLYYVKQRVAFRFNELYNSSFNPSSLQEDGRETAQALRACHYDLHRLLSYDLSQEVLATTLRVEQWMNRMARKHLEHLRNQYAELFPALPHEEPGPFTFQTPDVQEALEAMEPDVKRLARMFKNGKYFFEGEGKQLLKQELEQQFGAAIDHYIGRHQTVLKEAYKEQLAAILRQLADKEIAALNDHVEGWKDALELNIDLDKLGRIRERLLELAKAS